MTSAERKTVIQCMADHFDNQNDPKVGIFWYDEKNDELFGVTKINADELQFNSKGLKTISTLHKSWWQSQQKRIIAKKKPLGMFQQDYTMIQRGRIFQRNDGIFQLMCGSWINDNIENLVKEEFDLQTVQLERIIDEHWEIGHGWSEEYQ
jgi:hypothetical protein